MDFLQNLIFGVLRMKLNKVTPINPRRKHAALELDSKNILSNLTTKSNEILDNLRLFKTFPLLCLLDIDINEIFEELVFFFSEIYVYGNVGGK